MLYILNSSLGSTVVIIIVSLIGNTDWLSFEEFNKISLSISWLLLLLEKIFGIQHKHFVKLLEVWQYNWLDKLKSLTGLLLLLFF